MGRFRAAAADDDAETAIDMSPLIDCVFILLIFFIVTTVFVEETGVDVNKPQSGGTASDLEKTSILIAITDQDEVVYGGANIGPKAVEGVVRQQFSANPDIPVILQADEASSHGMFAEVYQQIKAVDDSIKVSFATERK
ncbi:MAG: biopolymer transporter ExbD [Planctomycetota bacterium]